MKRKLLLAGNNTTIINDFFYVMDDEFECITTSNRSGDIFNHINYFQPELFVYCFSTETKEDILKLSVALDKVGSRQPKMIIIGSPETCDEFLRLNSGTVKLVIHRPVTANAIKEKLLKYFRVIDEHEKERQKEQTSSEKVTKPTPASVPEAPTEATQKHVLIIDDDPIMLSLIKAELREHYNVATAISGKIALKFLERKHTDMILLDYEMPEEDGAEVFAKILANPATKDIPVVFLTGINDREKIQKVLAMKPQGYLLKPIECEQLVKTIRQVIG